MAAWHVHDVAGAPDARGLVAAAGDFYSDTIMAPEESTAKEQGPPDADPMSDLPPEVARLLYPHRHREPTRITLLYPELGVGDRSRLQALADAGDHEMRPDPRFPLEEEVHAVTFGLDDVEGLHALHRIVVEETGPDGHRVLVNGRSLPLVAELWLPLFWTLLP